MESRKHINLYQYSGYLIFRALERFKSFLDETKTKHQIKIIQRASHMQMQTFIENNVRDLLTKADFTEIAIKNSIKMALSYYDKHTSAAAAIDYGVSYARRAHKGQRKKLIK